jgi:hypothetical protein
MITVKRRFEKIPLRFKEEGGGRERERRKTWEDDHDRQDRRRTGTEQ